MKSSYMKFIEVTNQLTENYVDWCEDLYGRIDALTPDSPLKEVEQLKHEVSACLEFGRQFQFSPSQDFNWSYLDTQLADKFTEIREDHVRTKTDGVGSLRDVFRQFHKREKT